MTTAQRSCRPLREKRVVTPGAVVVPVALR